MTVRLYRLTGQYEAFALAHSAADAVKHGERGRKDCERVYDVTAEAAVGPVGVLAKFHPARAGVYGYDLDPRDTWTAAQWADAAPSDAAAEADRLRAAANDYDRRAALARTQANELARIAARAVEAPPEPEPEPVAEAAREAMVMDPRWKATDAGLPDPDGAL